LGGRVLFAWNLFAFGKLLENMLSNCLIATGVMNQSLSIVSARFPSTIAVKVSTTEQNRN
jgi:hypothetical protein